jgi:5-(carboxyamino)imidazole ribonucleotide mutase
LLKNWSLLMAEANPIVGIIMGSQSDWATMKHTTLTLEKLGISYEAKIISAHRTPDRLTKYAESARERGLKVLICGAGMAAALPGAAAALTPLPVLGVPMDGKVMGGLDALLAMAQMPGGIPVGTLAVGKAGAVNSAVLAASIIALSDQDVAAALDKFRADQTAGIAEDPVD